MNPLKGFLEPKSIAILGASTKPESVSALSIGNLLKHGYDGRVYLVNPKGGELFGKKVYSNIMEIDDSVELAIIHVPPVVVVDAIKECTRKGVSSAVVLADGLDNPQEGGKTITSEMLEAAKKGGLRIMGPNSMGVVNVQNKLCTSIVPFDSLPQGGFSIISQTGLFTGAVLAWITSVQNLGISKAIDLANKCDIDEVDCLEYLVEDTSTKVIGIHMEEVTDGKRFIKAAQRTTCVKPILALKPGRTEIGARTVATHTGSLAGKDESYVAAFSQSGIIRVYDIEELVDLAKAFIHLPPLRGKNISVVTYSGGWGALAADLCEEHGLSIAELSERSIQKIQTIVPDWRKIANPVDIWPPKGLNAAEAFGAAIRAVADDDATDAVLVLAPALKHPTFNALDAVSEEVARYRAKPIATWAVGNRDGVEKAASLIERNCLLFPTVRRAIKALSALYHYQKYLRKVT